MDLKAFTRQQHGFSLLESLIALVVFSIALLGLAAMYATTMSMSHSSYLRALATIQAMDLEERIRANPEAVGTDYVFSCAFNEAFPGSIGGSPSALAGDDVDDWCASSNRVFGGLLSTAEVVASYPVMSVSTPASSPVDYWITLEWTERSIEVDADNKLTREQVTQDFVYKVRK